MQGLRIGDIDAIRTLWESSQVKLSEEVDDRMAQREVSLSNIEEAIMGGQIIEEREGFPYRQCTIRGWASRKVAGLDLGLWPLDLACAVGDRLHIITVYWHMEIGNE
jgi:hypothetical protein